MGIPGFNRRDRQATADAGLVYLERRKGESNEAFEARLAAAAREREGRAPERPQPFPNRREQRREARTARREIRPAPKPPRRHRHHGLSLVGLAVTLVAALGALWIVLAVREGSFSAGGKVVDQKIAEISAPARLAANEAVDRTGRAVQNAGQAIEDQGQRIRKSTD